jgi:hypothetical protein
MAMPGGGVNSALTGSNVFTIYDLRFTIAP